MKTTIDRAGRLVVPKQLRDRLGLAAGTEVEIEAVGDAVVLRPAHAAAALRSKGGVLVHHGGRERPAEIDIAAFIRGDREARGRRLADRG